MTSKKKMEASKLKTVASAAATGMAPSENPFDAMAFELVEVDVHKRDPKEQMGVFVKSNHEKNQVFISRITAQSTADQSGAKPGDYVLAVNDHRVENKLQMAQEIYSVRIGIIRLSLARRRPKPLTSIDLKLPGNVQRRPKHNYYLCRLVPSSVLNPGLRVESESNEVLIASLFLNGPAFDAGLQARDRVLMVGSEAVCDQKQCEELLKRNEGKVFDILVERSQEDDQDHELQKVRAASNTPTTGVSNAPPEVKKLLTKRMDNLMKNLKDGTKQKPKASDATAKSPNP